VLFPEAFLQRCRSAVGGKPFDGGDRSSRPPAPRTPWHDFALRPSISTVQAPHWLVSQPMWVPVRLRCSRKKCAKQQARLDVCLAHLPLTVIEPESCLRPCA
jgi:hypothetical protein